MTDTEILTGDKINSVSKALKVIFKSMPSGTRFSGYSLQRKVASLYPRARRMYPDTILRIMREHNHYDYKLVSRSKSIYERV